VLLGISESGTRAGLARCALAFPEGEASISPPAARVWLESRRPLFQASLVAAYGSQAPLRGGRSAEREGWRSLRSRFPGGGGFDQPTRCAGLARKPKAAFPSKLGRGLRLSSPASRWPIGGEGGIRTPVALSGKAVFKTAAINHSATSPWPCNVHMQGRQRYCGGCGFSGPVAGAGLRSRAGSSSWGWSRSHPR
jgi:hypothetical protein